MANVNAYIGGGGGGSNGGFIYAALKPLDERKVSVMEIINRLRPKMNRLAGGLGLPAGGAGSAHRRPGQQCALPVHPAGRQCAGPGQMGTHPAGADEDDFPGFQDVNSDQQNGGLEEVCDLRPDHGRPPGADSQLARFGSLQRLWPGGSVGDLHPVEPVLRGARGSAPILAISRRDSTSSIRPLLRQWRHSAQRGLDRQGQHHALAGQPYRRVSLGDGVVQSCSRPLSQRCHARRSTRCRPGWACRRPSAASSPAPCRPTNSL